MANKKTGIPAKKTKKAESEEGGGGFSLQPAQIKQFANEVKAEFGKIAWPDKKHTIKSTVVVVIFVIMVSVYLGAVDMLLGKIITAVLR
jgi:preprotein translocase subunit SecE